MGDISKKIRTSSTYIVGGKMITPVINFFLMAYIVRSLTVDDYGIYNILMSFMAMIGLISSLGLQNTFNRFIPEFSNKAQFSNIKRLISRGMLLRAGISTALIAIIFLFAEPIFTLFKMPYRLDYFLLFSITILSHLEFLLFRAVLSALFLHKYLVLSQVTFFIVKAILVVLFIEGGLELKGLILGEALAYIILISLCLLAYRFKYLKTHPDPNLAALPLRRIIRYGGFSQLNEVGVQVLSITTDLLVISAYIGARAVGLYGFTTRLVQLISNVLPHRMLEDVIRPVFYARYTEKGDTSEIQNMYNLLMKITALTVIPVSLILFVLGDKIIGNLFDVKYLEGLVVLQIVAIFYGLNALMLPVGLVLHSIERVDIVFYSKIFAIYNLIGDLLVVQIYGIVGIAIVTSSAELLKNLFCYYFARKYVQLRFDFRGLFNIAINTLLASTILFFGAPYVDSIISLVGIVAVFGLVYLGISYLNKSFNDDERNIINTILPMKLFVF